MWQQYEDGSIVRHPDGYLTLHNTPYSTPLVLAVFYMNNVAPCPFQPKVKTVTHSNPEPRRNPYYETKRKLAEYRARKIIQKRQEWDRKYEARQQYNELKVAVKIQAAITQALRGKENKRKRSTFEVSDPTCCPLESCPKRVKYLRAQRKLEKNFRRNEPKPRRFQYPGYKSSTDEDVSMAASQISDVSGRRSRSPLIVAQKRRSEFLDY